MSFEDFDMLTNVLAKFRSLHLPVALFRRRHLIIVLFPIVAVPIGTSAQSATLTAVEQLASLAFNPSAKVFSSITLSGATVWTAGSLQDAGNVVFTASADGSSGETWSLASQPYSVLNTSFAEGRSCSSVDSAGKTHQDTSSSLFPRSALVRSLAESVDALQ